MQRVAVVLVSTLLAFVVAELVLRATWDNPYREEIGWRVVRVRMHAGALTQVADRSLISPEDPEVRLRTDARSYILPSFQYNEPDVTVAFLGGSTTECFVVKEKERFHALVSDLLGREGFKVNTLNAAASGNTLHDSLNILLNHVIDDRPDIAVLMHAVNDKGIFHKPEGYRSRMGRQLTTDDFRGWFVRWATKASDVAALTRAAKQRLTRSRAVPSELRPRTDTDGWKMPVLPDNFPPDAYRQRLKAFVHLCRDFAIEPVLMTEPHSGGTNTLTPRWIDAQVEQFNDVIREVGAAEGVHVIDLVEHLRANVPDANKPMYLFYDGVHVTDRGSRVYAEHIADRLLPLIERGHAGVDATPGPAN